MGEHAEVIVGVVGRAHGLRGEASIDVRTDEPERRFAVGAQVFVEGRAEALTVVSARWTNGRFHVRFNELRDRTAVEAARGWVLLARVPVDETPENEDEFYDRQLVGLQAVDLEGRDVGVVSGVIHLPAQELLVIDTPTGERLVPFVEALVPQINLADNRLTLNPVAGLIDNMDQ